ncbi:WXG100 family type VII secretion target [Saccharopolyspora sp. NPDC000359]|uniref:WXG100 family type VII secretion target n=1 Tax=Saccharopolyspora sp. NPDC000359 TaxID=3154251 RepID=UPI00331E7254
MADEIQYQYAILQSGVDEMRNVTNRLQQGIEQMANQTKTLLSGWEAEAANAYNENANQIHQAFEGMNQILTDLTRAVDTGANDFKAKDGQLAAQFNK